MHNTLESEKKAWVVAVDMGYGHQRTAYPLRDIAVDGKVLNANHYYGIPEKDKRFWDTSRSGYEFISRIRSIPIIGLAFFLFFDSFQRILGYYPKRDLSRATFGTKLVFGQVKRGWGNDLVRRLSQRPLPLVTTFFTPAFMAERLNYPGDIYCIICDADVARGWADLDPKNTRIKYLVPNTWTRERLKLYGVPAQNIMYTGYPLPKENLGQDLEIVKRDIKYRIINLDPSGKYRKLYAPLLKSYLGEFPTMPSHPLTLMFSIGGAGAQKDIALAIARSLSQKIKEKKVRFIIAVGTHRELKDYFQKHIADIQIDGWLQVLSGDTMPEYFDKFNKALRTTDILMTKPSELSFYAGLGIPIIIEPSIGSQEDFNRRWLMHVGAGVLQENPKYTSEWLFDLLEGGDFAEMAMQGFVEIEKRGVYNIENILTKQMVFQPSQLFSKPNAVRR